jgi:hypothetical protein
VLRSGRALSFAILFACGTPDPAAAPADASPDGPAKAVRDAYGEVANVLLSPNFALKWGPEGDVDRGDAESLLAALDATWAAEIEAMDYPIPFGSDVYRLNVYIGSTGPGTPEAFPNYAFASRDPEGYPELIYSTERVANVRKATSSAAHEFFHTVQDTIGTLTGPESGWWWEATATWMAEEVFPDTFDAGYLAAIGSYGMLPHVGLRHLEPPEQDWQLIQGHQYGAFVFCRDLTEHVGDPGLLAASFLEAGSEADVLRVLDRLLAARGDDLIDVFGAFAARNTVWDYANGARYRDALAQMAAAWPEEDHRVAEDIPADGRRLGPAPPATLPEHAGYDVLRMARVPAGSLEITFAGAAAGSHGSEATFRVTAVVAGEGAPRYLPVPLEAGRGSLRVTELAGTESLYLAVAAWSWESGEGEVFPFDYAVTVLP